MAREGRAARSVAVNGREVQPQLMVCLAGPPGIAPEAELHPSHVERLVQLTTPSVVTGYPAQHDSLETSISKVCAASFKPSTVVRYGKIISPNSVKVRPCLMARTAV